MPFLTNSEEDIKEMLAVIGVNDFNELISNIPTDLRLDQKLKIPESISEAEVTTLVESKAAKNKSGISFLGGGVYDHYIPAIIDSLISRSEFYTAYTPYQPEVSQGTLQSIYEFQSMICELTGMDVTNASMYEGGSALAEAMLLACSHTRKSKILVAETLNRRYKEVLNTYISHNDIEITELPVENFTLNLEDLKQSLSDEHAAVIIQHPNYFGYLEDVQAIGEFLREKNTLFISFYDPISLGLLMPPGEYGADIAIAEGQVLGNYQNFGGPFIGLFSTRKDLVRKIPGRIAGLTSDLEGNTGFVLTLQTREQHIRREKATSNICTNSGLLALAATIYLAALGKYGIKEVAQLCLQKSHYLADELKKIKEVEIGSEKSFFKEFVIKLPSSATEVLEKLKREGIFAGIDLNRIGLKDHILVAVTEKRTKTEMDLYISELKKVLYNKINL
jgi:glycine dehydrogenase subunit 1